jgi:site-specific DNA-methyltransferase (adenine-specific)
MVRITKPTGSILVHNIPKWLIYFGSYLNEIAIFRHWIAWNAMGSPLGKTLLPNHYGILYYVKSDEFKFYDIRMLHKRCRNCHYILQDYGGKKSQMHQFGPLVSDVWADIHRIRHKKRRDEHPCQLPIHLLERLLLMSSDEGDIVLDPFIGTGTTALAAKKLGRKFVGIDIDLKYVEITNKKLDIEEPTMINGCYVSIFLDDLITVRDKDWDKIKDAFVIPQDLLELEKREIYLSHKKRKTIKHMVASGIQSDLFSLCGEKE